MSFVYVEFSDSVKRLRVFRLYPKVKLLTKSKKIWMVLTDSVLQVSDKDAIIADTLIDCVQFDNEIVIVNVDNFERMFKLTERYMLGSSELFDFLGSGKLDYSISNIDEMKLRCEKNLHNLKKVDSIRKLGLYKSLDLKIIANLNKENRLGISIDKKTLEFPDLGAFVHLYNDDNLVSQLSAYRYLSINKKRIG